MILDPLHIGIIAGAIGILPVLFARENIQLIVVFLITLYIILNRHLLSYSERQSHANAGMGRFEVFTVLFEHFFTVILDWILTILFIIIVALLFLVWFSSIMIAVFAIFALPTIWSNYYLMDENNWNEKNTAGKLATTYLLCVAILLCYSLVAIILDYTEGWIIGYQTIESFLYGLIIGGVGGYSIYEGGKSVAYNREKKKQRQKRETRNEIQKASDSIEQSGFKDGEASATLSKARTSLRDGNYEQARQRAEKARQLADKEQEVLSRIEEVERTADRATEQTGLKGGVADEKLSEARKNLRQGNYIRARKRTAEAEKLVEEEERVHSLIYEGELSLKDTGLEDGEAGTLLSNARTSLGQGEYKQAYKQAEEAQEFAEKEKGVLSLIQGAEQIIKEDIPGGKHDEARDLVEQAHDKLRAGAFEEAGQLASEAKQKAKPSVEFLLNNARTYADDAQTARDDGEYDDSISKWEQALDEYEHALDRARSLGKDRVVADIEETIDTVETNLENTKLEQQHAAMVATAERANDHVEEGNDLFSEERYDEAQQQYETAREGYVRARSTARKHGFDEADEFDAALDRIDRSIEDCQLSTLDTRLTEAREVLEGEEYERAEVLFEGVLDDLNDLNVDRPDDVTPLWERAERRHVRSQLEQGRTEIERAEKLFDEGNYYEARETFEESAEYLEEVLSLATEYGLDEERAELDDLIELCTRNANTARKALFDIGDVTPDLASIDEISAAETGFDPSEVGPIDPPHPAGGTRVEDRLRQELPEHEVLEWVGSGGNADVHKIRLEDSGEVVALKVPQWQGTIPHRVYEDFTTEAETWEKLDAHDNIVGVVDWGTAPYPWMLLEYVDDSLREAYEELTLDDRLSVLVGVAEALEYAHHRGVIHLDIKPENVLLADETTPKIADWGLARVLLDHTRTRMGLSPPYSAPEQLTESMGDIDHRTDIYQLGVLAYEIFTGERPFQAERPVDLQEEILEKQPDPPSEVNPAVPEALDDPILRALAKEQTARFEATILFKNQLQHVRVT